MSFHASDFGLRDRDPSVIKIVVFFHYPCKDGLTSALVAYQSLPEESTLFIASDYVDPPWTKGKIEPKHAFSPDMWDILKGREVYIVDFSFPVGVLLHIADVAKSVKVYDHHKTFRENVHEHVTKLGVAYDIEVDAEGGRVPVSIDLTKGDKSVDFYRIHIVGKTNLYIVFSDKYCGAWLTHYVGFNGRFQGLVDKHFDDFVNLIDDRDMWKWADERSKAFHAAMDIAAPKDFFELGQFFERFQRNQNDVLTIGKSMLRYFKAKVDELVKRAQLMVIHVPTAPGVVSMFQVPVVNSAEHISETGHALLEAYPGSPFSAIWFTLNNGSRKWSLRGRDSDDFDVSQIAKAFGGGGHPKACGFLETIPAHGRGFHEFPAC